MSEDIRDKENISHSDVIALNFVRPSPQCVLRKHFRQGLRSHIMEVLNPADVLIEKNGIRSDGIQWFPKAVPRRIFRIFRTRLKNLQEALAEVDRVKLVHRYLSPDFIAYSTECIVEYHGPNGAELILCGFQDYVDGEILDPWTILDSTTFLPSLYSSLCQRDGTLPLSEEQWCDSAREKCSQFVERIKKMVSSSGYVPDLAGIGNLIMTPDGEPCLVDINNISPVSMSSQIILDEKGYPVCDKSIEALSLIEEKTVGRPVDMSEELYKLFLNAERKRRVRKKID